MAARVNFNDPRRGIRDEAPRGITLVRVADVDQMMADAIPERARRLRRANIQAAIHHRRVDAHDFKGMELGRTQLDAVATRLMAAE